MSLLLLFKSSGSGGGSSPGAGPETFGTTQPYGPFATLYRWMFSRWKS